MSIAVGTMVRGNGAKAPERLERLFDGGFECYQIHWWAGLGGERVEETARRVRDLLAAAPATADGTRPFVSALGLYGNPLRPDAEGDEARRSVEALIRGAGGFGCRIVGLFTGRRPGRPWEESLDAFRRVFGEFCRLAVDHGVVLAMENCPMDGDEASGDWNLAFGPEQWTRLYEALPREAEDVLGLEWEPAHQLLRGREPLPQLAEWAGRIVHVHGKDAAPGPDGAWHQTLPGNGGTAWDAVFRALGEAGFRGSVDIEGYHDPQWSGADEIPGQIRSAAYLRSCRDGTRAGPSWAAQGDDER